MLRYGLIPLCFRVNRAGDNMGEIDFIRVTRAVESQKFDCGVESINDYVRNSYFPLIAQHAYAYNIVYKNISLGYIQYLFTDIELDYFPEDIAEINPCIKDDKLSALHIRFLAIDKEYQNRKLGTTALQIMIRDVEDMAEHWPVRLITIDARIDLVQWYEKLGFRKMCVNTVGQDGVTVAMYFDCMRYSTELREYIEAVCK